MGLFGLKTKMGKITIILKIGEVIKKSYNSVALFDSLNTRKLKFKSLSPTYYKKK